MEVMIKRLATIAPRDTINLSPIISLAPPALKNLLFPQPHVHPSLPPINKADYTLVLDLDETLLHTEWMKNAPNSFIVHERPYVREFLRALKGLSCEVVIFTAGVQSYADAVLDIMDNSTQAIAHRLYRQHTTNWGIFRGKVRDCHILLSPIYISQDLGLLNRDLGKTLIIDNSPEVFSFYKDNGLHISSWEGHKAVNSNNFQSVDDYALINLFIWLEYLMTSKKDVVRFIKEYRHYIHEAIRDRSSCLYAIRQNVLPVPVGPQSLILLGRCFPENCMTPFCGEKKVKQDRDGDLALTNSAEMILPLWPNIVTESNKIPDSSFTNPLITDQIIFSTMALNQPELIESSSLHETVQVKG